MRKTYGYIINKLVEEMKNQLYTSFRYWYMYKLEVADKELADAYKSLSRDASAAADNLAYILISEEKLTKNDYHKVRVDEMNRAKKSFSIE